MDKGFIGHARARSRNFLNRGHIDERGIERPRSSLNDKMMTVNLAVDSRRCPRFAQWSQHAGSAKTQAPSGFSSHRAIAAQTERATFKLLPGCPRIHLKGSYSNSSRMRTTDCHRIVSSCPTATSEFDVFFFQLSFVNSVPW